MDVLSPRLMTILSKITPCLCLADIGSDHGYLIVSAVVANIAQRGVAVELNRDPFEQTRKTVISHGLTDLVDVRLGNGLAPLAEAEADAICVAGMGGGTIRSILENGYGKMSKVTQLVLQPNVDARELRHFLLTHDFLISDESLVLDGAYVYQVLKAIPGVETEEYSVLELEYGRHILRASGPLLQQVIVRDIAHQQKILTELSKGRGEAIEIKKQEVESKISELKRLVASLGA